MDVNSNNGTQFNNNFQLNMYLNNALNAQAGGGAFRVGNDRSPFADLMSAVKTAMAAMQMPTQPQVVLNTQNPMQMFAATLLASMLGLMSGNQRYGQMGGGMAGSALGVANMLEVLSQAFQGTADGIGTLQSMLGNQGAAGSALPLLGILPALLGAGTSGAGFTGVGGASGGTGQADGTGQAGGTGLVGASSGTGQVGASEMTDGKAIRTLLDNFDNIKQGKLLVRSDLEKAAKDQSKPELAAAAQHVLNNPALFDGIDTANNNRKKGEDVTDGKISKNDLRTARDQSSAGPTPGMDNNKAVETLVANWSKVAGKDDVVSTKELETAAQDKSNPELSKAAKFLLDNKTFRDGLDTAIQHAAGIRAEVDGKISRADITISTPKPLTPVNALDASITQLLGKITGSQFAPMTNGGASFATDLTFGGNFFSALKANMATSGNDAHFGQVLERAFSQFQVNTANTATV